MDKCTSVGDGSAISTMEEEIQSELHRAGSVSGEVTETNPFFDVQNKPDLGCISDELNKLDLGKNSDGITENKLDLNLIYDEAIDTKLDLGSIFDGLPEDEVDLSCISVELNKLDLGKISYGITENNLDLGCISGGITMNKFDLKRNFDEARYPKLDLGSTSYWVTTNTFDLNRICDEAIYTKLDLGSIFYGLPENKLDFRRISDEVTTNKLDLDRISDEATYIKLDLGSIFDGLPENKPDLGIVSDQVMKNKLFLTQFDTFLKSWWQGKTSMEFKFMMQFLNDPPQEWVGDDLFEEFESELAEKMSIISDYINNPRFEVELKFWTSYEEVGDIPLPMLIFEFTRYYYVNKKDAKPKPSREYYPRTGQLGFVDHLVKNLDNLGRRTDLLKPAATELRRKLQIMDFLVREIPQQRKEDGALKDLIQSFTSLAYEVEYAVDSYLIGDSEIFFCMFRIYDIIEEINIPGLEAESIVRDILQDHSSEPYIIPLLEFDIISNGFEISETTRVFFYDGQLNLSFHIRTWCLVSSYKDRKAEVFLQLLVNAQYGESRRGRVVDDSEIHEFISHMSEDKLKGAVYKLLDHERYFVILEDVGDLHALIDIVSALPGSPGSRVLVITPCIEVAIKCRDFYKGDILGERAGDQSSLINKPTTDNNVVGFVTETEMMLDRLRRESQQLHIISIVGMAGQGKSTLAMKLYNDPSIVDHFDTRMWCYVSQLYEKRGLLLELLGHVIQLSKTILHKSDEELAEILFKHLKGRRFLVFLDDVWTDDAWNSLRRCFPDDNNGSRIVFTTRIEGLTSQVGSGSIVQQLCPLSHEESWELLKGKVFKKESCPQELLVTGKKIAENCKGLPLSVVLVAGILEKLEKRVCEWEDIACTLSSHVLNAGVQGKIIIEMSYKHLPDYLRPCFLYFGAFLEDREVSASKLIRLWIAEGFVKCTNLKSLEDIAEDYLADLIGRSLVTVAQEKSNGRVKLCRVHDLLHEFCFTKANEENFLQRINGYNEHFPSSRIHLRRLSVHSKRDQFVKLDASGTFIRSLLFSATSDFGSSYQYNISFIFHNIKLVIILDLEDIKISNSFEEITHLVLLRYLAVQSYVDSIPSSIADLWNLETFIFRGLSDNVVKVPSSIWDMEKLRHVHISNSVSFDLVPNEHEMFSLLDNLQTFSTPSLAYGDDMEKVLTRLPHIRKLKCIFLDSWNDIENCNQFPQLEFVSQLVSLSVRYNGEVKYPCKFNLPSNLRKLTLSNFRMPWNQFSQLATLTNLEVLKLENNTFVGETWEMKEDEVFPKLKLLKLDCLNLVKWSALFPDDNFPHLEHLVLHKCEQLEEIPPYIGENTLQMIKVMWCSPFAATSVKKIQEERRDFCNELNILIHPKVSDFELSS